MIERWDSAQAEWIAEREKLAKAREDWDYRAKSVEDQVVNRDMANKVGKLGCPSHECKLTVTS
jgi:hypothetical protein